MSCSAGRQPDPEGRGRPRRTDGGRGTLQGAKGPAGQGLFGRLRGVCNNTAGCPAPARGWRRPVPARGKLEAASATVTRKAPAALARGVSYREACAHGLLPVDAASCRGSASPGDIRTHRLHSESAWQNRPGPDPPSQRGKIAGPVLPKLARPVVLIWREAACQRLLLMPQGRGGWQLYPVQRRTR